MLIDEKQGWRRPITAHAEETYDLTSGEPKRAIMWYLHGKHKDDDALRLAQGLACVECLTVFPAKPELANVSQWRPHAHLWEPMRTPTEVLTLVAQGRCPSCKAEVSDEMYQALHRGADSYTPPEGLV